MGKVYLWAAVLLLAYNDGRIDFDIRRDMMAPARALQVHVLDRCSATPVSTRSCAPSTPTGDERSGRAAPVEAGGILDDAA
jgi:hypothetical protein